MARILITSGATRQYLDPVRYLTNASSGRMGQALAEAALEMGHAVLVISGPVEVRYPAAAVVIPIISTEELLEACLQHFPNCDGLIGAAAPCDYRPQRVEPRKISKTGEPLLLELLETPDVVATVAAGKRADQWVVGFALETDDQRFRAINKMQRKSCDMMVLNGPEAMNAEDNAVEIFIHGGQSVAQYSGSKHQAARVIVQAIQQYLCQPAT